MSKVQALKLDLVYGRSKNPRISNHIFGSLNGRRREGFSPGRDVRIGSSNNLLTAYGID